MPGQDPHRRVEPHGLLQHHRRCSAAGAGRRRPAAGRRAPPPPRRAAARRTSGCWSSRCKRPAQRAGGGLVPGEQQRDQFVAQPLPADPRVGLLAGGDDQPGQHVVAGRRRARGRASATSWSTTRCRSRAGPAEAQLPRQRHPHRHRARATPSRTSPGPAPPRRSRRCEPKPLRSASSRVRPSTPRVRPVISCTTSTGPPPACAAQPRDQARRPPRRRCRPAAAMPLGLEHRLDHLALLAPQLALAGQQAVAERPPGVHQADALVVVGRVVGEHVLGVVGVVEEVQRLRARPAAGRRRRSASAAEVIMPSRSRSIIAQHAAAAAAPGRAQAASVRRLLR